MASNKLDPNAISLDTATNLLEEFIALEDIDLLSIKKAIANLDQPELLRLKMVTGEVRRCINHLYYYRSPNGQANSQKQNKLRKVARAEKKAKINAFKATL